MKKYLIVFLILTMCGGSEGSIQEEQQEPQPSVNQETNWRELYELPYSLECMDERLGVSVVREFQTGSREPTEDERNKIQTCDLIEGPKDKDEEGPKDKDEEGPKDKDEEVDDMTVEERIADIRATQGGWIRTDDPKMDQFVLGYLPTPDEWRCGAEAVGKKTMREIKAGTHTITEEEYKLLEPCFRASPESLTHPLAEVWEGHCIPIDVFVEFADYYRPSWEQLECHLKGLERYEMPNQVRYLFHMNPFGIRNSESVLFPPLWDRIMKDPYYAEVKFNFSPALGNFAMPPKYDEEGNSMICTHASLDSNGKYIFDDYWAEEEIRGAAIAYIIEKKKGRRIYADVGNCSNVFVVQGDLEDYKVPSTIKTVEKFKEFVTDITIPHYTMKAKAAEKVKAEIMKISAPFNGEIEVPFTVFPYLYNLSATDQVELAQWYLDTIIPVVREHFKGYLWVASYIQYDDGDPNYPASKLNPAYGQHWKNLSFKNADHVSFTIDGFCDYRHLDRYLDITLNAIMEIVKRDNVTWHTFPGIGKRAMGPQLLPECLDEFETREFEMNQLIISKLEDVPIKPYFLTIPQPPRSWTKNDEGYWPTAEDTDRGQWWIFSLDEYEMPEEIAELWLDYAERNVIDS